MSLPLYQGEHRSQYDGGPYANQNCVPTSLADAADQVSTGKIDRTGSQVRALVKVSEETNPLTPGWSMQDAALAAKRLGIQITPAASSWDVLRTLRAQGRGVLLQGDSDVFTEGCSGAFDGNHCVYLPPLNHSDGRWRLGDPICPTWRWEKESVLRAYAGKFAGSGRANYAYTAMVPIKPPDTGTEDPMPLVVTNLMPVMGVVTVVGDKHYAVQIADREYIALANGVKKRAVASGTLVPPLDTQPGDRASVYVVGDEAAVLLAMDVTFKADEPDCTDAVAAEHERVRAAAIRAAEAL